jgi:hypothetical protein
MANDDPGPRWASRRPDRSDRSAGRAGRSTAWENSDRRVAERTSEETVN